MNTWQYFDAEQTVVFRVLDNGMWESCIICDKKFQEWIAAGNTPLPYEPPAVDPKEQARADLAATDKEMARIAEDLINTLIAKGVIAAQDLAKPAMDKLSDRAALRKALQADGN